MIKALILQRKVVDSWEVSGQWQTAMAEKGDWSISCEVDEVTHEYVFSIWHAADDLGLASVEFPPAVIDELRWRAGVHPYPYGPDRRPTRPRHPAWSDR